MGEGLRRAFAAARATRREKQVEIRVAPKPRVATEVVARPMEWRQQPDGSWRRNYSDGTRGVVYESAPGMWSFMRLRGLTVIGAAGGIVRREEAQGSAMGDEVKVRRTCLGFERSYCASCDEDFEGSPELCPGCSKDSLVTVYTPGQLKRVRAGERTEADRNYKLPESRQMSTTPEMRTCAHGPWDIVREDVKYRCSAYGCSGYRAPDGSLTAHTYNRPKRSGETVSVAASIAPFGTGTHRHGKRGPGGW